jgi:hypothetical protein
MCIPKITSFQKACRDLFVCTNAYWNLEVLVRLLEIDVLPVIKYHMARSSVGFSIAASCCHKRFEAERKS